MYTARLVLPTFYKKMGSKSLEELVIFYIKVKDDICSNIIKAAINRGAVSHRINHLKDGKKNKFLVLEVDFKTLQDLVYFFNDYTNLLT